MQSLQSQIGLHSSTGLNINVLIPF